jgi:methylmalonyl-CoA mutase C-terminal domain/subunit
VIAASTGQPVASTAHPIRVLLAKPGLDGHNRGVHVIAKALADAGMEVIYLGLRRTPDEIAAAAVAEDVDVIGLSILSGAHMTLVGSILTALTARGGKGIPLVVGGIIPDEDAVKLRGIGVFDVLGPGSRLAAVVDSITAAARARTTNPQSPVAGVP